MTFNLVCENFEQRFFVTKRQVWNLREIEFDKYGSGEGNRTPDTRIMIPLLYQLSYPAKE